jgi:predicted nucleic acid-binding protein
MIVLDTDVLIDILAGEEPWAGCFVRRPPSRRLATTSINCFELLAGARTPEEADRLRTFLRPLVVLPLDRESAEAAADASRALRQRGEPLALADLAVAGVCLELEAPLLTRSRRHFHRIPGLRLEECPPGS